MRVCFDLALAEYPEYSGRMIAEVSGLSRTYVHKLMKKRKATGGDEDDAKPVAEDSGSEVFATAASEPSDATESDEPLLADLESKLHVHAAVMPAEKPDKDKQSSIPLLPDASAGRGPLPGIAIPSKSGRLEIGDAITWLERFAQLVGHNASVHDAVKRAIEQIKTIKNAPSADAEIEEEPPIQSEKVVAAKAPIQLDLF